MTTVNELVKTDGLVNVCHSRENGNDKHWCHNDFLRDHQN